MLAEKIQRTANFIIEENFGFFFLGWHLSLGKVSEAFEKDVRIYGVVEEFGH